MEKSRMLLKLEELENEWRLLTYLWNQGKGKRAILMGLWRVLLAYAAFKRTSLVGKIDLRLIESIFLLSVVAVGYDGWRFLSDVFKWLTSD